MKNLLASTALIALLVSGISGLAHAETTSVAPVVAPTVNATVGQTDASIKEGQSAVKQDATEAKTTVKTHHHKLNKKLDKTSEVKPSAPEEAKVATPAVAPTATLDTLKSPAVDATKDTAKPATTDTTKVAK